MQRAEVQPSTDLPLTEIYDVALLDLDGVVYVGVEPVPGVAAAIGQCGRRACARRS